MNTKTILVGIVGLMLAVPARAEEGWYRFPTALEGKWTVAEAMTGGESRREYVGQIVEIEGSSIVLRSDTASNTYRVTFANPVKSHVELDLTATRDGQTKTFRCLLTTSKNQIRLVRPQNDLRSRPQGVESPADSETIFTLIRDTLQTAP
ncbi:MAG: hypothetical protein JNM43_10275 [Planctomycetaceae bacterium]|nr:hypothetical protein [Planctomycetaceae bacterium]